MTTRAVCSDLRRFESAAGHPYPDMEHVSRIVPRVLAGVLCGGGDCDRPAAPGDTHCALCRDEIERTYGEEAVS